MKNVDIEMASSGNHHWSHFKMKRIAHSPIDDFLLLVFTMQGSHTSVLFDSDIVFPPFVQIKIPIFHENNTPKDRIADWKQC